MPVVGTAGHVDHGKSTLVLALTGRDPDRWPEEKRRGLTIDLGFAWTTLPGGIEVSFVDVPGHERFIKNMLAGVEAIDVALLVVAADEGWMPQSEEHLAVLDLLGVAQGVVALTKVDKVDDETRELARIEVEEALHGTSLHDAAIVEVAAPQGNGLDQLAAALAAAVTAAGDRPDRGRARLWIDRAFTVGGAGTVVTGTLLDGSLEEGDRLTAWPGGEVTRVRGLQSHERPVGRARPGFRTAVNLSNVDRDRVPRGSMLGRGGQWEPSGRWLAAVRSARYLDEPIGSRGSFQVHLGSGVWSAELRPLEELAGSAGAMLVKLRRPIPVAAGDRFIVREAGRRRVVGGGVVLDPSPPQRLTRGWGAALEAALQGGPDEVATALLEIRGRATLTQLAAHSGGGAPRGGLVSEGIAFSEDALQDLLGVAREEVRGYHQRNPLRPGIPKASLAGRLGLDAVTLDRIVSLDEELVDQRTLVAAAGFRGGLLPGQQDSWVTAADVLRSSGLAVPGIDELGLDRELLHALARQGDLVLVAPGLAYLPEQMREIEHKLSALSQPFTVAQARDHLALSRKYVVPLLEWLDGSGFTVRSGDLRRVRAS